MTGSGQWDLVEIGCVTSLPKHLTTTGTHPGGLPLGPCGTIYWYGGFLRVKPLGMMSQYMQKSFSGECPRTSVNFYEQEINLCCVISLRFQSYLLPQHNLVFPDWYKLESWNENERREHIKSSKCWDWYLRLVSSYWQILRIIAPKSKSLLSVEIPLIPLQMKICSVPLVWC